MRAVLLAVTLVGYATGDFLFVRGLYRRELMRWGVWAAGVGFFAQTLWLATIGLRLGAMPGLSLFEWVGFLAWVTVGAYLAFALASSRQRKRTEEEGISLNDRLGGFLLTVVLVIELPSLFLSQHLPRVGFFAGLGGLLAAHILLTLAAYSAFLLSTVWAIMYIEKERELKHKRFRVFYYELPALDVMDAWSARLVGVGWAILTAALLGGMVLAKADWGGYWNWDPKETFSLGIWVSYGVYLGLRWKLRWRGRYAAWWNMATFLLVLVNLFGINLWFGGPHTYNI